MTDLATTLRLNGRLRGGELIKLLGISRATLMRLSQAAGNQVIVRGQARRTTYAARRTLRGSSVTLPLYRVDEAGDVGEVARIDLIYPDGCVAEFLRAFGWPLDDDMQEPPHQRRVSCNPRHQRRDAASVFVWPWKRSTAFR